MEISPRTEVVIDTRCATNDINEAPIIGDSICFVDSSNRDTAATVAAKAQSLPQASEIGLAVKAPMPAPTTVLSASFYHQFIEKFRHPSSQAIVNEVRSFVTWFPMSLPRALAARRIHSFLTDTTPKLLAVDAFVQDTSDGAQRGAAEGLERFVVLKLHKLLFRHSLADLAEDDRVDRCIRESPLGALPFDPSSGMSSHFDAAISELRKVVHFRAPRDKVVCLLNAYHLIEAILESTVQQSEEKDLCMHHLLTALIIHAAPPNIFSNVEYAVAFRHPVRITAEEQSCLQDFRKTLLMVVKQSGTDPATLMSSEDLPSWLSNAGVSFRFETRSSTDVNVGEVEDLLSEYHRMVEVLQELTECKSFPEVS